MKKNDLAYHAMVLAELLDTAYRLHFSVNLTAALREDWLCEHFESVAATIDAAGLLAKAISDELEATT